jgi:hypothetical protein
MGSYMNYIFGALGILVSLILFLVGYRQTIGAGKERVGAANVDWRGSWCARLSLKPICPAGRNFHAYRRKV